MRRPFPHRVPPGLPLRAVAPNAVTALALCSGLTGIRFAISHQWEQAVTMIMVAAILDGIDGGVARMLRGESRFGAELDSLSDAISFGVSPALILYLWSLSTVPQGGWLCALLLAVFCALRLARFNARIDELDQPHKSAGFLTGIPAPAGAFLAMLPLYVSFWIDLPIVRSPWLVGPWVVFVATLMVSNLATFSWKSMKLRRTVRFEAIVVFGAAMVSAPWPTLTALCAAYLLAIPFSIASYARIRRLRAAASAPTVQPTASARSDDAH